MSSLSVCKAKIKNSKYFLRKERSKNTLLVKRYKDLNIFSNDQNPKMIPLYLKYILHKYVCTEMA